MLADMLGSIAFYHCGGGLKGSMPHRHWLTSQLFIQRSLKYEEGVKRLWHKAGSH